MFLFRQFCAPPTGGEKKRVKAKIHVQDDVISGVVRCKSKQEDKVFDHVGKNGGARCPFALTKTGVSCTVLYVLQRGNIKI